MAINFFTAPTFPSLGTFGFSKQDSDSNSNESSRPKSESVGAIIKCSDCGGDVPLEQLGEHVCEAPRQDETAQPPEPKLELSGAQLAEEERLTANKASSLNNQTLKTLGSKRSEEGISSLSSSRSRKSPPNEVASTLRRNQQDSSSESSTTYSELSNSSSQSSSNYRKPFFEKYAEIVPRGGISRLGSDSSPSARGDRTPGSPDSISGWPARKPRRGQAENSGTGSYKAKRAVTPPTSPEPSPRKGSFTKENITNRKPNGNIANSSSMPSSHRTHNDSANSRRAEISQRLKEAREMANSRSATSGLDKILATRENREFSGKTAKGNSRSTDPRDQTRNQSAHKPQGSSGAGLEDLMGDLMAEMEKKAERTNQMIKKRPTQPQVQIPESRSSGSRRQEPQYRPGVEPSETFEAASKYSANRKLAERTDPSPESPGIRPSDSISQWGAVRSPSPIENYRSRKPTERFSDHSCQRCGQPALHPQRGTVSDEKRFCYDCYSELYLPKCRKCAKPIEKGAVTDRVGKVLGKYHARCFNCFQCSAPFPTGDFYVWERKPVCSKHYHRLAGTTCCNENCGEGIEGPCVSLNLGPSSKSEISDGSSYASSVANSATKRLYHPEHFTCARMGCRVSLHEYHFVINGKPWCERHALEEESSSQWPSHIKPGSSQNIQKRDPRPPPSQLRNGATQPGGKVGLPGPVKRMERRRTIVQNVRAR